LHISFLFPTILFPLILSHYQSLSWNLPILTTITAHFVLDLILYKNFLCISSILENILFAAFLRFYLL
jgi:hypothetical protein